jgi:hypothetical protein
MDTCSTVISAERDELCNHLDRLRQNLDANAVEFDDAERLWLSTYRPKARKVADALLSHLPDGDPRFVTNFRLGNLRIGYADVVTCIETPFCVSTASAHLATVRSQLRKLGDNVS